MKRLLAGKAGPEESQTLVRKIVRRAAAEGDSGGPEPEPVSPDRSRLAFWGEESADAARERAIDAVASRAAGLRERLESARAAADERCTELLEIPARRAETVMRNQLANATPELALDFVAAARARVADDPQRGVELARLARFVAAVAPADSPRLAKDLEAETRGDLANLLRVTGELAEADAELALAVAAAEEGTGDAELRARLLSYLASLRSAQSRPAEGLVAARRAQAEYRASRDVEGEARALMNQGILHALAGELGAADRALALADEKLARGGAPRLRFAAAHNRVDLAVEAGDAARAAALLPRVLELARTLELGALDRLRLRWLEARVAAADGRAAEAEAIARETKAGFLAAGLELDAAMLSLELAALLAEQGRAHEVRALAEEVLPQLEGREVYREAFVALRLVLDAARQEALEARLVHEALAALVRARQRPAGPRR